MVVSKIDDRFVSEVVSMTERKFTQRRIAELLGASEYTVRTALRMSEGKMPMPRMISERTKAEILEYLSENPDAIAKDIAKEFLVDLEKASHIRKQFIASGGAQARWNKPNVIANRKMLAKTCNLCGLFLGEEWFHKQKKNGCYSPSCKRCNGRRYPDRNRKNSRKARDELQELSMKTASRHYQDWSEEEDAMLKEMHGKKIPVIRQAINLGRTYAAVQDRIHNIGISNKPSWKDPDSQQWVIKFERGEVSLTE